LYVAFRAWDPEPITAQLTQRDADLLRDDAVVLVVDSTNDRRSGYYFITNALGTQADGRISDDGRTSDARGTRRGSPPRCAPSTAGRPEFSIPLSSITICIGRAPDLGHQLRPQPPAQSRAELLERPARQSVARVGGGSTDATERAGARRSHSSRAVRARAGAEWRTAELGCGHRCALCDHRDDSDLRGRSIRISRRWRPTRSRSI
jgi:hypothetical protein